MDAKHWRRERPGAPPPGPPVGTSPQTPILFVHRLASAATRWAKSTALQDRYRRVLPTNATAGGGTTSTPRCVVVWISDLDARQSLAASGRPTEFGQKRNGRSRAKGVEEPHRLEVVTWVQRATEARAAALLRQAPCPADASERPNRSTRWRQGSSRIVPATSSVRYT